LKLSKYFDTITDSNIITVANPTLDKFDNLVNVCNQLDLIRAEFGILIVSSGLRPAKAHNYSQHQDGFAVDFMPKSLEFKKIFDWIRFNMKFDQLILEKDQHGNQWIHFSYKKEGNRKMALIGYYDYKSNQMEYKSA
jgi:hypothetical protein